MLKNVASQKLIVFAFNSTTNAPVSGDAANITAYVSKDYGSVTVLADTSATEMDATNAKGYYLFDLAQAETNADVLLFSAKSGTANVVVIASPATVYTSVALANAAHGGAAAVLTLEREIIASTTSNEPAVKRTGNGTAPAVLETGGATGPGRKTVGGATSGDGWLITTTVGHGINANPTNGDGLRATGNGPTFCGIRGTGANASGGSVAGAGILAQGGSATSTGGGTAGRGLLAIGGAGAATTNPAVEGFYAVGGTNGGAGGADAFGCVPSGAGFGINATVTGNITGSLSGSVGSVTGSVGSVTGSVASVTGNVGGNVSGSVGSVAGNVSGNVTGTLGGMTAAALAQFFTLNSTKVYADAVSGSVVKEIAANSAGGGGGSGDWSATELNQIRYRLGIDGTTAVPATNAPHLTAALTWDGLDAVAAVPRSSTATMTIASPGVVTWNSHGLAAGQPVSFTTTGALPTGVVAGTVYYVLGPATNTFQLAATPGGSAINTSGSQSGVHTAYGGVALSGRQALAAVVCGMGVTSGNDTASMTVTLPAIAAAGVPGWAVTRSVSTGDKSASTFTPPA